MNHTSLANLAANIFESAGAPKSHARVVADHLADANLKGHDSHGIMRVSQYLEEMERGHIQADAVGEILRCSGGTALMDGHRGFGQVVAMQAMKKAIDLAQGTGIAAVSMFDCAHTGRLGAYVEAAVEADMIGMLFVNASGGGQSVAPFGGIDRRLATNPLAIAAPSGNGKPLVLDFATSSVPEGKVRDYHQKGQKFAHDVLFDAAGNPSNDPADFYESGGAIQPLGGEVGYKGFGLAFMIDILAGGLSGSGCCSATASEPRDTMLLIAINTQCFGDRSNLTINVQNLIEHVKSSRPAHGVDQVFVPGELEWRTQEERLRNGIELNDTVWNELMIQAERWKVDAAAIIGQAAR